MNNLLIACLFLFVFIIHFIWIIKIDKNNFKTGFDYGNDTLDSNGFKDGIEELQEYIEESKKWNEYNDFDRGIEQAIKERVSEQCNLLNDYSGGDWYFCYESLAFKDSLVDREIYL